MSKLVPVRLLTKPGCHLCDDARAIISEACAELQARNIDVQVEEFDILQDPKLARLHAEEIPVVFVGRKRHAILRVDRERFITAVEKASRGGFFG